MIYSWNLSIKSNVLVKTAKNPINRSNMNIFKRGINIDSLI